MKLQRIFRLPDGRKFFSYIIPSTVSMLLAGVYTLIDGLFVGWGAGSDALAAINVAFPFLCLFMGLGDMLGNGTAITIGYCRGRNKPRAAGLFFGNLLTLLLPLGILLALAAPLLSRLVAYMGASSEIVPVAREYALIIGVGAAFPIITNALVAVMRHDRAQFPAMRLMLVGLAANIVLDYLLVIVIPWGAAGSAWATVAAQVITSILAINYFRHGRMTFRFHKRYLRPYWDIMGRTLLTGLPSLGLQLTAALLLVLYNVQALSYGGLAAVAAYAIISYVTTPVVLLNEGIALGIQPLISYYHGAGLRKRMNLIFRYGNLTVLAAGGLAAAAAVIGRDWLPAIFNASGSVAVYTATGLLLTAPALLLHGFTLTFAAYFQARQISLAASLLIYGDCLIIMPLSLFLLPVYLGLNGVWAALLATKIIMTALALLLYYFDRRAGMDEEYEGLETTALAHRHRLAESN